MNLNETLGNLVYDNLINETTPTAEVWHVTYGSGNGVVKRGTVLALDNSGEAVPYGADFWQTKADQSLTSHAVAISGCTNIDENYIKVFDATNDVEMTVGADGDCTAVNSSGTVTVTVSESYENYATCAKVTLKYGVTAGNFAEPYAIAADTVDTTGGDVEGVAYMTGCFNRNNVITVAGCPLDTETLREKGIFFNDSVEVL